MVIGGVYSEGVEDVVGFVNIYIGSIKTRPLGGLLGKTKITMGFSTVAFEVTPSVVQGRTAASLTKIFRINPPDEYGVVRDVGNLMG